MNIFLRNENNFVDEVILLEGLLDLDLEAAPHEPVSDEGHGGLVHPRGGVAVGHAHVHDHTLLQVQHPSSSSIICQTKILKDFTIMEKAPTRALSWLKAPTESLNFANLRLKL